MLKESVSYIDYNDVTQNEILYFNLTKTEMMDLLDLQPRLEAWAKVTDDPNQELSSENVKEMLEIIKLLIEKSYGVRSSDGRHFRKSSELFTDFKQSAVYDTFVFGMFENPERAVNFMIGIMPKGLVEDAQAQQTSNTPGIVDVPLTKPVSELTATDVEVPAYIRENREPTKIELHNMSTDELQTAFQRKFSKN